MVPRVVLMLALIAGVGQKVGEKLDATSTFAEDKVQSTTMSSSNYVVSTRTRQHLKYLPKVVQDVFLDYH